MVKQLLQCSTVLVLFCEILWPEVQSHSVDSHVHFTAPRSVRVFSQVCPHNVVQSSSYIRLHTDAMHIGLTHHSVLTCTLA